MIDIDTSAIVTIVFEEPERESFLRKIEAAQKVLVAAVTVLETKMVVHGRKSERGVVLVDDVLRCANFEIIPVDQRLTEAAFAAFIAFGKGQGHPALLNFGDVISYALAKTRGLPLVFKGGDFSRTDIAVA